MTYHTKLISGGKLAVPADLRRAMGIKDGDELVLDFENNGMVVKSYQQVLRDVQAGFKSLIGDRQISMVDELIAERRAEAARE